MARARRKDNSICAKFPHEWNSWRAMCDRCKNPNFHAYDRYGGRGIKVCAEWLGKGGFARFLVSMGQKPTPKHSLERIDRDAEYSQSNCKWATHTEQMNNRSTNRTIAAWGRVQTLAEWCREKKIDRNVVCGRLARGASGEQALSHDRFVSGRIGRPPRDRQPSTPP